MTIKEKHRMCTVLGGFEESATWLTHPTGLTDDDVKFRTVSGVMYYYVMVDKTRLERKASELYDTVEQIRLNAIIREELLADARILAAAKQQEGGA